VALGLCRQSELDAAIQKANERKAKEGQVMTDDERRKLVSTQVSLTMAPEPRMPSAISGLETFSLGGSKDPRGEEPRAGDEEEEALPDIRDADSFFNLPATRRRRGREPPPPLRAEGGRGPQRLPIAKRPRRKGAAQGHPGAPRIAPGWPPSAASRRRRHAVKRRERQHERASRGASRVEPAALDGVAIPGPR
jgi:hypothetical protein